MLPEFDKEGTLPAGIHWATWAEVETRFGLTPSRRKLLGGLRRAVKALQRCGCQVLYVDGSFVTVKTEPADYDACWDINEVDVAKLPPVFLNFSARRAAQKRRYYGEFFPAQMPEGATGRLFLEFFQCDKETGGRKGIVGLRLQEMDL